MKNTMLYAIDMMSRRPYSDMDSAGVFCSVPPWVDFYIY